jgi:hypothetical protein
VVGDIDLDMMARIFCFAFETGQIARAGNECGGNVHFAARERLRALTGEVRLDPDLFEFGFLTGWHDCEGDEAPLDARLGRRLFVQLRDRAWKQRA